VLSFTLNKITLEPQATDKDRQFALNTNFIKNVIICSPLMFSKQENNINLE